MSERHEHIARELADWLVGDDPGDLRRVVLLVGFFPDESWGELRGIAQLLRSTNRGALLEAALFLRHPGERPPGLIDHVLRAARRASDGSRADIYRALGPSMATKDLDYLIDEAKSIRTPKARDAALASLTKLRDLRLHPIAPPGAAPAPAELEADQRPDQADARLAYIVLTQTSEARDALLHEVLVQARRNAQPITAAAPPPAADRDRVAATPRTAFPSSPAPPEPRPSPAPAPAPTRTAPDVGGVIRSVGGVAVGAAVLIGSAIRNVLAARRAAPGERETAAPTIEPVDGDAAAAPKAKQRVVNTGLASVDDPGTALDPDITLAAAKQHLFWLEIGEVVAKSIEVTPAALASELARQEAELDVVLFDVGKANAIVSEARRGRLKLRPNGSAIVLEQPMAPPLAVDGGLLQRRLFFPVNTPIAGSTMSFRCNLYHDGVLIQSRLVRCLVREQAEGYEGALRSTLDYVLARSLNPDALVQAGSHELSILTNENAGGTHGFYVAAQGGKWARSAEFDGQQLQNLVDRARAGLRLAAWGDTGPWRKGVEYRYENPVSRADLEDDLITLAIRGYTLYDRVVDRLAAGAGAGKQRDAEVLAKVMRGPSTVQVATHANPRFLLPASMIYDRKLRIGKSTAKLSLCDEFLNTLAQAAKEDGPIEAASAFLLSACFKGDCPNDGNVLVVCPSGMWGFRHSIGLPVSLESDEEWAKHGRKPWEPGLDGDPPVAIDIVGQPQFAAAVSTDQTLKWPDHEKALQKTRADLGWHLAESLDTTFELMKQVPAQILYFYCHGGFEDDLPFIRVGPVNSDEGLFGADLRAEDVLWTAPRPLVFINGCHTAEVEPVLAHELVSSFVTTARASGVIGTEITIFVPLARGFAESFFTAFFAGQAVGEAMRTARLALLAKSNPLGLAYTSYAMSTLHLTGLVH